MFSFVLSHSNIFLLKLKLFTQGDSATGTYKQWLLHVQWGKFLHTQRAHIGRRSFINKGANFDLLVALCRKFQTVFRATQITSEAPKLASFFWMMNYSVKTTY